MKKVLVTGADGLVGNAIRSISGNYDMEFSFISRKDYDLTNQFHVIDMFKTINPNYVIHCAARVGGIGLNLAQPAQQYYNNIMMNTMVLHNAYENDVEKFIGFSSVCAFPGDADLLTENILTDGKPFVGHKAYAYSKRMVDVQIEAYKSQYGLKNYCSILPVNIFGENDNYDLEAGHVIPSLIHRCFLAKQNGTPFEVWGSGKARREFIYSLDLAEICLSMLKIDSEWPRLLIASSGEELYIKDVAEMVADCFEYRDKLTWLTNKPDGQLRRPSKSLYFKELFPSHKFYDIKESITESVHWFNINYPNVRGAK